MSGLVELSEPLPPSLYHADLAPVPLSRRTCHARLAFLFSGAWFSAALVSFNLHTYRMRPAREA